MMDILKQELAGIKDDELKSNMTREFIQTMILKLLFDRGAFKHLAFTGGTALRILHGLRRYSEDLDFNLITPPKKTIMASGDRLQEDIKKYGWEVECKFQDHRTVATWIFKFPELMERLGIRGYRKTKLQVKVEIDTNPPKGGNTVIIPYTKRFVLAIAAFDLPSLFATKLHACLYRKYVKGRDYYDLVWYLGKKINPNFKLLNNAARQTEKRDPKINKENLAQILSTKMNSIDFNDVRNDVERFLEDKSELKLLNKDVILGMIQGLSFHQ